MQGTAKEIIVRYLKIIGKSRLPPFWALSWHAASRAYETLAEVDMNLKAYNTAKVLLDDVLLDMGYQNDGADIFVN